MALAKYIRDREMDKRKNNGHANVPAENNHNTMSWMG